MSFISVAISYRHDEAAPKLNILRLGLYVNTLCKQNYAFVKGNQRAAYFQFQRFSHPLNYVDNILTFALCHKRKNKYHNEEAKALVQVSHSSWLPFSKSSKESFAASSKLHLSWRPPTLFHIQAHLLMSLHSVVNLMNRFGFPRTREETFSVCRRLSTPVFHQMPDPERKKKLEQFMSRFLFLVLGVNWKDNQLTMRPFGRPFFIFLLRPINAMEQSLSLVRVKLNVFHETFVATTIWAFFQKNNSRNLQNKRHSHKLQ